MRTAIEVCEPGYTQLMNDEERKLNAIVGAAIKALAESGADDELVGSFANLHRTKVAQILGQPSRQPDPPDIVDVVAKAVETTMARFGIVEKKKQRASRRVNVVVDGRRTSLTLRAESLERLAETMGGSRQVAATVQSLAQQVPREVKNRSAWVEERLASLVSHGQPIQASKH